MTRKTIIQEIDGSERGVDYNASRLAQGGAKEHMPHVTMKNPKKRYMAANFPINNPGGKGFAGS